MTLTADGYDAWYRTDRGRWIGETEFRLIYKYLQPHSGDTLLDVGCGTGYFTRRFAQDSLAVTGIDADAAMIDYAQAQRVANEQYQQADATILPFADKSFDYSMAITSLCFIAEQQQALAEMVRVTRKRIVLGLLNHHSLLYWQKGRHGGSGAYRGAQWHRPHEARELLRQTGLPQPELSSAIFLPSGGRVARGIESMLPNTVLCGGFLLVAASVSGNR
jgi:SAM-dependent methyltransferase